MSKITIDRDVLEQVLYKLYRYQIKRQDFDTFADAITALSEALAQPAQQEHEPWNEPQVSLASVAQPAQQPLSSQEVESILSQHDYEIHGDRARYIVRMTERAHRITGAYGSPEFHEAPITGGTP